MGRLPKHPSARRGHQIAPSATVLYPPDPADVRVPPLPVRPDGWSPMTKAWWKEIWASPMAAEYEESDMHGLWVLAACVDDFWTAETAHARQEASREIRLQGYRFGISPMDRRRLQWTIENSEEAKAKGAQRRQRAAEGAQEPSKTVPAGVDPRTILKSV